MGPTGAPTQIPDRRNNPAARRRPGAVLFSIAKAMCEHGNTGDPG
jgi:hypothetical protein